MHLKTRVVLGVATVGAAIGAALVPASTAMAATPTLTVTLNQDAPNLNAQDGDTVTAVGSGFTANATIALVQCSSLAPDGSGCDTNPADAQLTQADANGGFTKNDVVVHTGTFGSGTCTAASTCFIVAANAANQAENAGDDFLFDNLQVSPRTGLKNGTTVNLVGAGYKANSTVYVTECTSTDPAKALQNCDVNSVETYPTDAKGTFTGTYTKTHTGVAAASGPYPCTAGNSCIIAGSDSITNPSAPDAHIGGGLVKFAAAAPLKSLAVSAHANHKHIAKNKAFKISGKATSKGAGVKGLRVVLDKIKGGTPHKVASGKTGKGGAYAFTGLKQKKTTKYVVVIAKQKGYKAAVSKTVKVSTP